MSLSTLPVCSLGPGWEPLAEYGDRGPCQAPLACETPVYQSHPRDPSYKSGKQSAICATVHSVIDRKPHWSSRPGNPEIPGGNPTENVVICQPLDPPSGAVGRGEAPLPQEHLHGCGAWNGSLAKSVQDFSTPLGLPPSLRGVPGALCSQLWQGSLIMS